MGFNNTKLLSSGQLNLKISIHLESRNSSWLVYIIVFLMWGIMTVLFLTEPKTTANDGKIWFFDNVIIMLKEFTKNTCAKYKRYEGIGKNDALNLLRNVLFL